MATKRERIAVRIESQVVVVRGERAMLDADLAEAYGVSTKVLNQAVKRNIGRFPTDFAFRLSSSDVANLRSQFVTSRSNWGGRRSSPIAFTEHGVIMAAAVLNSRRAVEMSVFVVRAFIRLRDTLTNHAELKAKLLSIERTVGRHDLELKAVLKALRQLLAPARPAPRPIGFATVLSRR